jgi:hypothetical protein
MVLMMDDSKLIAMKYGIGMDAHLQYLFLCKPPHGFRVEVTVRAGERATVQPPPTQQQQTRGT